jgi:hypothetical protein
MEPIIEGHHFPGGELKLKEGEDRGE